MPTIITVENISKLYHIGARQPDAGPLQNPLAGSLRDALGGLLRDPFSLVRRNGHIRREELWALKDVSFSVDQGEIVGLIGSNGAGKSTLFKILSRITAPTTGRIQLCGRIGSLLEVGTGFHPELTGRENVFLNGAILGMKREEIGQKFDEIVAFSEIERFIDTPVKYYSSGMYMRLAFAVAAHLEPEILIVDEVLAVGDAAFQKKCLGKMGEVTKEGRTVLFVSHNMVAVQSLCGRVLWLNKGEVVEIGSTATVVSSYLKASSDNATCSEEIWEDPATAPGNEIIRLRRIRIVPEDDHLSEPLSMTTPFLIEIEYWNLMPDAELHITLHIYTEQEIIAFTTGNRPDSPWRNRGMPAGLFRSVCHIPSDLLNAGRHRFSVLVVKDKSSVIYQYQSRVSFDLVDLREREGGWFGREPGIVNPLLRWTTAQIDGASAVATVTKN
ncbi:MAG: ABC transporter ATP-binding protein [Acidobacteriota bacterium]|nr:ABC transporter ATP-binding protein [Acidobacteriota bacterium]